MDAEIAHAAPDAITIAPQKHTEQVMFTDSERMAMQASLTSGAMMTVGDLCCQMIQQARKPPGKAPRYDWQRAARFGVVGLTLHGPFFSTGFRLLDGAFGTSKSFRTAVAKTATGQVTLFPIYLSAFYTYISLLEGKSAREGFEKLKSAFAPTYMHGTVFWSCVNLVNFTTVPPSGRILYVNAAGLLFNTYLSWSNDKQLLKEVTL